MDKLREILNVWARLKTLRDEITEEIEHRNMLHMMRQRMRNGDIQGVAEIYACIHPKMERHDDELTAQYLLDGLGELFKHHNIEQASFVLSVVSGLTSETFHRSKSLFADYVVKVSSKYANHQVTDYMSTMLILSERLDPNDVYKLRAFIDKLCAERLCAFAKDGEAIIQEVSDDTRKSTILKLDKWIDNCTKLLGLKYGIDIRNIHDLYERAELLYFDSCIKSIILKDQKHGSEDLVFLVRKVCTRINKVPMCNL
eukprot:jgi/Antlo1/1764/2344